MFTNILLDRLPADDGPRHRIILKGEKKAIKGRMIWIPNKASAAFGILSPNEPGPSVITRCPISLFNCPGVFGAGVLPSVIMAMPLSIVPNAEPIIAKAVTPASTRNVAPA